MLDFLRDLSVNGGKTFRPTSGHRPGTRTFALHERYKKTLGTDNLRMAAALPNGEDANEWVAMKVVDMFNEVELVQGMVSEFCTSACCSVMSAGPKYEYLWADSQRYPKPTKVSAPEYIGLLFQWVKAQLDDEKVFPTQIGAPFPPDFRERVHNICKRLFRVYAHIFYCHFERVVELSFEAHLNSCFKVSQGCTMMILMCHAVCTPSSVIGLTLSGLGHQAEGVEAKMSTASTQHVPTTHDIYPNTRSTSCTLSLSLTS